MRKLVAILFSLLLVCSLSVVAFADAANDPEVDKVVTQTELSAPGAAEQTDDEPGEPCPMCESGTVRKNGMVDKKWRTYQYQLCEHADIGGEADLLQRRLHYDIYECDHCCYSREDYVGYDYAVYCQQKEHRYITTLLPEY